MKHTYFLWCMLLMSKFAVGMERAVTKKTKISNIALAEQIATFDKKERKKYALTPRVVASIIKTKLLNDLTQVSPEQYQAVKAIKKQPQQYKILQKQIYDLLRNPQQTQMLQEVRSKLYEHDLRVFTNLYEEFEEMENKIEIYKTYEDTNGAPIGWCFCWMLEVVVAGILVVIGIHSCP